MTLCVRWVCNAPFCHGPHKLVCVHMKGVGEVGSGFSTIFCFFSFSDTILGAWQERDRVAGKWGSRGHAAV